MIKSIIYSRLSRSFTARGFSSRDPTKGIRLISSRVKAFYTRGIWEALWYMLWHGYTTITKIGF